MELGSFSLGIRGKLLSGFGVVLVLLALVGVIGYRNTVQSDLAFDDLYSDQLTMTTEIGKVQQALYELRLGAALYSSVDAQQRAAIRTDGGKWIKQIDEQIGALATANLNENEQQSLKLWQEAYPQYLKARIDTLELADQGRVAESNVNRDTVAGPLFQKANDALNHLIADQTTTARATRDEVSASADFAIKLIVGLSLLALVVGLGLALSLARSITGAVRMVADAAQRIGQHDLPALANVAKALARGDLTQNATISVQPIAILGHDELAVMATDLNAMIERLQETGSAFGEMAGNLRDLIGQVRFSADGLATTSGHLGETAAETDEVVRQVAVAIQSVAAASQEAGQSAQSSSEAVGQLGQAIDAIARGASEQARQIQDVAQTATHMADGVEQVANNAQSVAGASQQTRAAAESGARAVRDTVRGMQEIKEVVADAAVKVAELGQLGEKIGAVVETIDDIAEQTNLLALNAAIEAARAGEHGRGFAVVADEVRKLAERSQRETKAIAELIRAVQDGTRDAVSAMEQGSTRVELGSAKADEAGAALAEILEAVDATVSQVTQIASAAQEMAGGARTVVEAMQSISAVVEENSAATEEMAAQSGQVMSAIDSIASVSEETSAATEEVSASTEEMSAQVDNLTEQLDELAATAEQLQAVAAGFRLDNTTYEGSVRDQRLVAAVRAHASWRIKLEQAIASGKSSTDVATARKDSACPFGKWLYEEIDQVDRHHPQYEPVRELHAKFHTLAASVLELALAGQRTQARAAIEAGSDFSRASIALTRAIGAWRKDDVGPAAVSLREVTSGRAASSGAPHRIGTVRRIG
ncbi:MAG: methyl-accepting chemotaxis protein [Chloroflexota bacterium]